MINERPPKVYTDTSVFGGMFDDEFAAPSRQFFEAVRAGKFHLVTSEIVREEIGPAPPAVRELFNELIRDASIVPLTSAALDLQEAYQQAGILSQKSDADALHVALASVANCDMIAGKAGRY